ncbi:hypothetical protein AAC387_Pa06g0014 [Persea americana]
MAKAVACRCPVFLLFFLPWNVLVRISAEGGFGSKLLTGLREEAHRIGKLAAALLRNFSCSLGSDPV